jgi:hypothetical protein
MCRVGKRSLSIHKTRLQGRGQKGGIIFSDPPPPKNSDFSVIFVINCTKCTLILKVSAVWTVGTVLFILMWTVGTVSFILMYTVGTVLFILMCTVGTVLFILINCV